MASQWGMDFPKSRNTSACMWEGPFEGQQSWTLGTQGGGGRCFAHPYLYPGVRGVLWEGMWARLSPASGRSMQLGHGGRGSRSLGSCWPTGGSTQPRSQPQRLL